MSTVVIGIGNRFRGDDGAGPAVIDRLEGVLCERKSDRVRFHVLDGESSRVIETWTGATLAIVVDASRSGGRPGEIRRFETHGGESVGLTAWRCSSSHGLGVSEAIELAEALDRLPRRLIVYTVEGSDFAAGTGLSADVERVVDDLVERVRKDLSRNRS